MPCSGGYDQIRYSDLENKLNWAQAALCAILTVLDNTKNDLNIIENINEIESGVGKRDLSKWWLDHKAEDLKRKQREAEQDKLKQKRNLALSKLSKEERDLLGLK